MHKREPIKQATGFTFWIVRWHLDDNTQIGVLARHIRQDIRWPVNASSYESFINYLNTLEVEERMKKALCDAWQMYEESLKRLSQRARVRENYNR